MNFGKSDIQKSDHVCKLSHVHPEPIGSEIKKESIDSNIDMIDSLIEMLQKYSNLFHLDITVPLLINLF